MTECITIFEYRTNLAGRHSLPHSYYCRLLAEILKKFPVNRVSVIEAYISSLILYE